MRRPRVVAVLGATALFLAIAVAGAPAASPRDAPEGREATGRRALTAEGSRSDGSARFDGGRFPAVSADPGVPPSAPTPVSRLARGKSVYDTHCARCHGPDGDGTTLYPNTKSLLDVTQQMTTAEILRISRTFVTARFEGEEGAKHAPARLERCRSRAVQRGGRVAVLLAHLETFRSGGYVNPKLLVETSWVALHAGDPGVRVVDARTASAYAAGHLPGAVSLDTETALRNPEDRESYLPDAKTFADLMERLGIGNDTHVVVYDERGGRDAARLWYALNVYGHERVSLVNGGWSKWVAEGRSTTKETPTLPRAAFRVKATPTLACPTTELLTRKPAIVVLDTRTAAEFSGEEVSRGATRAGRIPGAVHVNWEENVTGPHRVFKSAAELKQLYAARGVTPEKEIVAYCATGGRAAQTLFTLKLLGYPNVRLYYGSFADYSARPEAPVAK